MFIRLLLLVSLVSLASAATAQRVHSNDNGYQAVSNVALAALPTANDENDTDTDVTPQSTATSQSLGQGALARPLLQQLPAADYFIPQPRAPPART
ncbi:hypothetical protein J6I75_01510 [Pseudidiomarina sp. 1APP75-27a]|uniref:hypothetical protein n=1 Tax=Pseudidiomarina terrestris TaxID=2820060 RepID=UPI002B053BD9|nr:hypothetical protein [Pseudidiomarina sp. 1APP75-27a]MEA3587034.1 hypothetical protein [Pseudidiomarina sp. 1APP75-27a]